MRSTTAVSNTTSEVRSVFIDASTAPNTLAYTTDDAIDPLLSMARTTSFCTPWLRRPYPTRVCGTIVPCSGR